MMFTFIAERCSDVPIVAACRAMRVTTSGFYEWRARQVVPAPRTVADRALTAKIVDIHRQSRATYGSPRVHAELRFGLYEYLAQRKNEPIATAQERSETKPELTEAAPSR